MEILRRTWQWPDHYYWLTSLLAAQGVQAMVCRTMALITVTFGAIAMMTTLTTVGPVGGRNHSVALGIGVITALLALGWLRGRWPTRRESTAFVVAASLCIAASCLIQSQPLAGMLGCVTFAVLAAYVAFFHSARLLMLNTAVATTTTWVLGWQLIRDGDPVAAVGSIMTIAAVYVLLPLAYHALVRILNVAVPNADIDPLTGLLNRDAFDRETGELFGARGRVDDRYLVIALVSLDNLGLLMEAEGKIAGDRALVSIAQVLRETTRGGAIVAHNTYGEFLITDTFVSTDATPLIERVRGSVAGTPPKLTASIGVVSIALKTLMGMPPQEVTDELIGQAGTLMLDARRAGGNQARCVMRTEPPELGDAADTEDPW